MTLILAIHCLFANMLFGAATTRLTDVLNEGTAAAVVCGDGGGAVGGAVVHDDDFGLFVRKPLCHYAFKTTFKQLARKVVVWDYDREEHGFF